MSSDKTSNGPVPWLNMQLRLICYFLKILFKEKNFDNINLQWKNIFKQFFFSDGNKPFASCEWKKHPSKQKKPPGYSARVLTSTPYNAKLRCDIIKTFFPNVLNAFCDFTLFILLILEILNWLYVLWRINNTLTKNHVKVISIIEK